MTEPAWLAFHTVAAIHETLLARFGGASGLRDAALLESALARPQTLYHYAPETDLARLAACYAYGIVQGHPMVDGNKRTGFVAAAVFLVKNGAALVAPETEVVTAMIAVAAGEWDEDALAGWIRAHLR